MEERIREKKNKITKKKKMYDLLLKSLLNFKTLQKDSCHNKRV